MYVSPEKPGMHRVILFPHEREVAVPLKYLCRRRVQSHFIYVIQRYYGIVRKLIYNILLLSFVMLKAF